MTPKSALSAQPAAPSPAKRRKEDRPAEITAALKIFAERGFAAARLRMWPSLRRFQGDDLSLFRQQGGFVQSRAGSPGPARIGQIEAMIGNFDGPSADLIRGCSFRARQSRRHAGARKIEDRDGGGRQFF